MPGLFHVSDGAPLASMSPRPSPAGTLFEGRRLVWAVDEAHLGNYLLPRECPRVCWSAPGTGSGILAAPAGRVIAVEHAWRSRLDGVGLHVHELDPDGFACVDETAGYWVCDRDVRVQNVERVDNCPEALARLDVELRLVPSLWPYVDAVVASGGEFSVIRQRNAAARPS